MKKSLSLVLAIAMVFSMFSSMAFAGENQSAGEYLKEIGVITGDNSGSLMEDETWVRQDVTVILSRLLGAEAEAKATAKTHTFADVTDPFYDGYISWAKENNLFQGHSDVRFGYTEEITTYDFLAVMLRALGHDTTGANYANVGELAVSEGLVAAGADLQVAAKRGALYTIVQTTVHTEAADGVVLGQTLGLPGFEEPAPAELAVVGVSATNLKQVVVEFNQDVTDNEDAADTDSYSIEDATVSDVDVDGTTATVTFEAAFDQQAEKTLTVEGVVEEVELEVDFIDTTLPVALSAEVVGNDTIKVTFSEPINAVSKNDFEVDGGDLYIKNVSKTNNDTEVNVELYSNLEEGTVSIQVDNEVEDFAGFGVLKTTLEAEVVEDDEAPVVVGYKDATPTGVTLIFNEDIEIQSDAVAGDFYHTNSNNDADAVPTLDGKELTIAFTGAELPEGTAYVYIEKESVNDLWDNENAKISVEIEVTVDEEAPTVDKVKVEDEDQLLVTFSEEVAEVDNEDFTILEDGEELENIVTGVAVDGKKVTVTLNEDLSGDYVLAIEGVEDLAGNEIEDTTVEFTVDDLTKPDANDFTAKLYNAGAADQMIKVSFGEAMATEGVYAINDKNKYIVDGHSLADTDAEVSIKVVDNGKAVEIEIEHYDADDHEDGITLAAGDTLKISRVADAAGNVMVDVQGDGTEAAILSFDITLAGEGTIGIEDAELTDKKTVKITFADLLTDFDGDDIFVFNNVTDEVYGAGDTILGLAKVSVTEDDGKTVATVTLAEEVGTDPDSGQDLRVGTADASISSENAYGELLGASLVATVADKAAPTKGDITFVNSDIITIAISEDLDADYFSAGGTNGFSVSGGGEIESVSYDAGTDLITLNAKADKQFNVNTNVSYTSSFGLVDIAGNKLASFDYTDRLEE